MKNITKLSFLVFLFMLTSLKVEAATGDCLTLIASHESDVLTGDEVCLTITARNFTDMVSFQHTMAWDGDVLEFNDIQNVFSPGIAFGGIDSDKKNILWSETGGTSLSLLDDSPLYEICFTVIGNVGANTAVTFTDDPLIFEVIQADNNNLGEISATYWAGSVTVGNLSNNSLDLVDGCAFPSTSACGNSNGAIEVSIGGGQAPYSFSWTGKNGFTANTEDLTGLINGAYFLTVTDVVGEELLVSFQVDGVGDDLSIQGAITADACSDPGSGSIALSVLNGQAPYEYLWSNGATTESIFNLVAGGYTVTVTDASACTAVTSFTVSSGNLNNDVFGTVTPASCLNSDGGIDLTVSGNSADYTFLWNTGATSMALTGLTEGDYTVTVTNVLSSCVAVKTYTISSENIALAQSYECDLMTETAELFITVLNSNEIYDFEWSTGTTTSGASISSINDLSSGIYSVTVTGQSTGCFTTLTGIEINCENVPPNTECTALIMNSQNTTNGAQICVPITTQGFNNLLGMQYTHSWDPNVLAYSHTQNYALSSDFNFGVNQVGSGLLTFLWSTDLFVDGDVLPDGTVFYEVCFDVVGATGSSSEFAFSESPTPFEVIGADLTLLGFNGINGTIHVGNTTSPLQITSLCATNPGCIDASAGGAIVTVEGGTPPYTYTWDDEAGVLVSTSNNFATGIAGTFSLLVMDSNGETVTAVVTIINEGPEVSTNYITGNGCFGGSDGLINISINGGAAPYNFEWSNGENTEDPSGLPAGIYTVTVTDINGCVDIQSFTVDEPNELLLSVSDYQCLSIDGDGGAIEVTATGGTSGYTYEWSNGNLGQNNSDLVEGEYEVTVTDFQFCTAVLSVYIGDCVWPGDTDTSGVVNNFDLLNIGLAFGANETSRPNASIAWMGQESEDWLDSTPNSMINYKHIDTDGSGLINNDDTLAIIQNWGEVHNFTGNPNEQQLADLPPSDGSSLLIPFYVRPDTIIASTTVSLPVILGEENDTVGDLYGLAFSVTYDPEVVVTNSAYLTFADSWLGDLSSNMITIQKTFHGEGRIDIAMTRTDGNTMTGFGEIASLFITIEDDIVLFKGSDQGQRAAEVVETQFGIENIRLITNLEEEILANPMTTTTFVQSIGTGINDWEGASEVNVFPNPVSDQLYVNSPLAKIESILLYDVAGKVLMSYNYISTSEAILNAKELKEGTYIVKIQTEKGPVARRVVVMKK